MKRTLSHLKLCRYIWFIGAVAATLLRIPPQEYSVFVFLSLLLFIHSQIRLMVLKNRLYIASLFVELLLVVYLQTRSGGYIYFILFATLLDAVLYLQAEAYLLFVLIAAALVYSLISYSAEWVFIIILFYLIIFLLLLQLRRELNARTDTEILYDQIRKNNYELEAARTRLLEYSKQVEQISQLEERNRISRELHDSIGHDLTGILMQVDASLQILPVNQEKGLEILSAAYQNISQSIEGVRRTVRQMRPAAFQTTMASLRELIGKFQKDTGVQITLHTTGTPFPLYPSIEITLYKNTREALTNSVRHGGAQNILIHLTYNSDSVQLSISDDGMGTPAIKKGFGLSGMEERLELVGGSIRYSGENGFCITMHIPRKEIQ